jgi:uncharacterized membrane protein
MYAVLAQQQPQEGGLLPALLGLVFGILVIAAMWRIFTKAGRPGWVALIPIYNTIVLLEIVGRPWWWLLLMLIPFVNFVVAFIIYNDLAKSFGKGTGFMLGLVFLSFIFFPILGFGNARYLGPAAGRV